MGNQKKKEWGKMSMCDAERRLLANALLDIGNEWFVLVSESCLPFTNFSSVYRYISGSRYSFIGAIDDLSPYGRGRSPEHDSGGKPNGMTKRVTMVRDKPKAIALNIIEDKTFYPKFEACCQPHACYVDKHYFPTMLHIQAPHLLQ